MHHQWYVGFHPRNGCVICGERTRVEGYARFHVARRRARTWGQFRMLSDLFDHTEGRLYESFADFTLAQSRSLASPPLDDLWRRYLALDNLRDRPPLDHEPFDRAAFDAWFEAQGYGLDLVRAALADLPPVFIDFLWDSGLYAMLKPADQEAKQRELRDALVAALGRHDQSVLEDQAMIDAACDAGFDVDEILSKLVVGDQIDRFLGHVE